MTKPLTLQEAKDQTYEYFFYDKNDEFIHKKYFTCSSREEADKAANKVSKNWLMVTLGIKSNHEK